MKPALERTSSRWTEFVCPWCEAHSDNDGYRDQAEGDVVTCKTCKNTSRLCDSEAIAYRFVWHPVEDGK